MHPGKRLIAALKCGYHPKRLVRPGKRLQEGPRRTATGRMICGTAVVAASLCALAFSGATDLSTAYLQDQDSVSNAFVIGTVTPSVEEKFDAASKTKENVTIQNGGNAPVYIRASLLIYWEDAQGRSILSEAAPERGTDYEMAGPQSGWSPGSDGYYYYTQPVRPGGATSELIETLKDKHPDSTRLLSVEIVAQAVQASPAEAVTDVFQGVSIDPDSGTLTPP